MADPEYHEADPTRNAALARYSRPAPPRSPLSISLPDDQDAVPTTSANTILPIWPAFHQSSGRPIWEMYFPPYAVEESYAQKLERARRKLGPVLIPAFNPPRHPGNERRHSATQRRDSTTPSLTIEDIGHTIREVREMEEIDSPTLVRAIREFIPAVKTHNTLKAHYNNVDFRLFEAMEANERLGNRNDELEDKVEELRIRLMSLSGEMAVAKDAEAKKNDKVELEAQIKSLEKEIARLGTVEFAKELIDKRNRKLFEEVETLETRVSQLKEELELCQNHSQGLEKQILDVRDELTRKLEDQDSQLKSAEAIAGIQEGEISALKLKGDDLENDLVQCKEHGKDLEKKLMESQGEIRDLNNLLATLQQEKLSLENSSAQNQGEIIDLKDRLATVQRDNRGLAHTNRVLKEQVEEKEHESQRTEEDRQEGKDKTIARYRRNCESLLNRLQKTESDLAKEQEFSNSLGKSMKTVAEELEQCKKHGEEIEEKLAGANPKDLQDDTWSQELEDCRNHGKELEEKLVEEKDNARRSQESVKDLKEELDKLRELYTGAGNPSRRSGSQIWIDLTAEKTKLAKRVETLTEQLDSQSKKMERLIKVAADATAASNDKTPNRQTQRIGKLEEQLELCKVERNDFEQQLQTCRKEAERGNKEIATSHKQLKGISTSVYNYERASRELKDQELSHRWRKHQRSINAIMIRLVSSLQDRSPDFDFARAHIAQAERDLLALHRCYRKEIKAVDEDILRASTILEQTKLTKETLQNSPETTSKDNEFAREHDIQALKELKALHSRYTNEIDAVSHDIGSAWLYLQQQDELMKVYHNKTGASPKEIVSDTTEEKGPVKKAASLIANLFRPMEKITPEETHEKNPSSSASSSPSPSNPDCERRCEGLVKALDQCCEELASLTAQVTTLQTDNADLQDRLDTQNTTFQEQADEYVAASRSAEAKYQTARAAFQELTSENNNLKRERTVLQQEITALNGRQLRPETRRCNHSQVSLEGSSPVSLQGAPSPNGSPEKEAPKSSKPTFPPGTHVSRDSQDRITCVVGPPANRRRLPSDPYYQNLIAEHNVLTNENTRFRKYILAQSQDPNAIANAPNATPLVNPKTTMSSVNSHGGNRGSATEYNELVEDWNTLKAKYAAKKRRYRALTKECRKIVWCNEHPLVEADIPKSPMQLSPKSPSPKSFSPPTKKVRTRFPRRPDTLKIEKSHNPNPSTRRPKSHRQRMYRLGSSSSSEEKEGDGKKKDLFGRRKRSRSEKARQENQPRERDV